MKKYSILLLSTLLLWSCGEKSTEDLIAEKNTVELKKRKNALEAEITKINNVLKTEKSAVDEALVSTKVLTDTVFNHCIEIQGNVDTKENIAIQPQFSGNVTALFVKNGQTVSKDQILARIDDAGMGQQYAQLETQYNLAKTTYERQKNLWDQKIGSEIQFLQAKTQMQAAQKGLSQMKAQLAKTVVRAPFSGTIENLQIQKGQVVAPGTNPYGLMQIVNINNMYVTTQVPEAHIAKVKVGTEVEVFVTSLNRTYKGKVRQVSKNINTQNRSFAIEIAVNNSDKMLRPNQVAKLKIIDYTNPNTISIPSNAILEDASGNSYVYIIENASETNGIAKKVMVTKGQTYNNYTEIKNGLSAKDRIVLEGVNNVSENMKLNF
jgi:membrane fusion protein, multidrug efflux system